MGPTQASVLAQLYWVPAQSPLLENTAVDCPVTMEEEKSLWREKVRRNEGKEQPRQVSVERQHLNGSRAGSETPARPRSVLPPR